MGSRDEEVRSWKLQTFTLDYSRTTAWAVRLIDQACEGRGSDPCENRDPFPVTGYRKIDIRYLYTADHGRKRRCM